MVVKLCLRIFAVLQILYEGVLFLVNFRYGYLPDKL